MPGSEQREQVRGIDPTRQAGAFQNNGRRGPAETGFRRCHEGHIGICKPAGGLDGAAPGIVLRAGDDETLPGAAFERFPEVSLFFVFIGGLANGEAQCLDIGIGEEQVLGIAPREIAVRHAANEERGHVPLAGLKGAHDMDHVATVIGGLE